MAILFNGVTANEVWVKALNELLKSGEKANSRNGNSRELLHVLFSIENPKQKWVYSRLQPMSIGYALAELVWIMNGEERSDIINFWNPILPVYAGDCNNYYGAYGNRIRFHFGFDQLEGAYYALQNNPENRQVVIQIYDTKSDFPLKNGGSRSKDIPCNICSMVKVRGEKLEWSQTLRSNDIYLGVPYNFVIFTSLQEILAGWLGLKVGSYNHYSDSLHLYDHDYKKIGIGTENDVYNVDSLILSKDESDRIWPELYKRMIALTDGNISGRDIYSIGKLGSQFVPYNNIMAILAAYVAKKRGFIEVMENLIKICNNDLYLDMWERWTKR